MAASEGQQEGEPVRLYVYDLSHGMARHMSQQLTGRAFDAIYHTSIVVFGREHFFGQGIMVTSPGQSHHGAPIETHDLGRTQVDRETFEELLASLRSEYTPESYHLLRFNCNHFSNHLAQILTGTSIPDHIVSLPDDFLETPLGRMLAPSIDAMFRPAGASRPPDPILPPPASRGTAAAPPSAALGLLNQTAQSAFGARANPGALADGHLRHITTPSQLEALLREWPCVAVLFTSATCPPCRIIDPAFEELANRHAAGPSPSITAAGSDDARAGPPRRRIAFAKAESGAAHSLFASRGVTATPTVLFFARGRQVNQLKGADVAELRSRVDLTLFEVYRAHPHTLLRKPLSSLRKIPTQPIRATSPIQVDAALRKLDELISKHPASSFAQKADLQDARKVVAHTVVPWLQRRFPAGLAAYADDDESKQRGKGEKPMEAEAVLAWRTAVVTLQRHLPPTSLFPVLDMLRAASLDAETARSLATLAPAASGPGATASSSENADDAAPLAQVVLRHAASQLPSLLELASTDAAHASRLRPYLLTLLRLLSNLLSHRYSCEALLLHNGNDNERLDARRAVGAILVEVVLQPPQSDASTVRAAAASAAFNAALAAAGQGALATATGQGARPDFVMAPAAGGEGEAGDATASSSAGAPVAGGVVPGAEGVGAEWEAEMVSALAEAIKMEERARGETVHRLAAALFTLLYRSAHWDEVQALVEALDLASALREKAKHPRLRGDDATTKAAKAGTATKEGGKEQKHADDDDEEKDDEVVVGLLEDCATLCEAPATS